MNVKVLLYIDNHEGKDGEGIFTAETGGQCQILDIGRSRARMDIREMPLSMILTPYYQLRVHSYFVCVRSVYVCSETLVHCTIHGE